MSRRFERILAEAITAIEGGSSLEEVLGRYPDDADQLRRHLILWESLSRADASGPSPDATHDARRLMLRAIAAESSRTRATRATQHMGGAKLRLALSFVAGGIAVLGALLIGGAVDLGSGSDVQADPIDDCLASLDFNDDGMLDVNDVVEFKDAIENQDAEFDLNDDGTVDVFDAVAAVNGVVECFQALQPAEPTPPGGS